MHIQKVRNELGVLPRKGKQENILLFERESEERDTHCYLREREKERKGMQENTLLLDERERKKRERE